MPADVTVSFPFSSVALSVSSKLYVASPAPSPISKSEVISIALPSYVTAPSVAVIEGVPCVRIIANGASALHSL